MQINRAVLEIFDFTSSLAVFSEKELTLTEASIHDYIQMHVVRALKDPSARTGYIVEGSSWGKELVGFRDGKIDIITIGKHISESIFEYMKQATDPGVIDVIICEARAEVSYVCILLCEARDGYTHQLYTEENGELTTELVEYRAVLPSPTQKLRAFMSINLDTLGVRLFEPKGEYDGEKVYILGQKVFQLQTEPSSKDTVKVVQKIINKVAKAHESNGVVEIAKAKELLSQNADTSDRLELEKILQAVFSHNPVQQTAALEELEEAHMDGSKPMSREYAKKVGKQHKIKTDTGIEIIFPVEYIHNREFMEIVSNTDGTLRIELKNIGAIQNKS